MTARKRSSLGRATTSWPYADRDQDDQMLSIAGRALARATGLLRLESEVKPDRGERITRHPGWNRLFLFWLPEAGELSSDAEIMGTMRMIRELKRHPQVLTMLLDRVGDLREVIVEDQQARQGPERRLDREAERDTPDRLARANARRERRRARSLRRRGRPRLGGHYCLAYLVMIMLGITEVTNFVHRHDFEEIWTESGFTHVPDYSTVWQYFAALEKEKQAFQDVAEWLIQQATRHDRRIGQFVWVDATKWQTNARLEHCCTNREACEELSKRNWEERKIRPPARKPKRMQEEELQRLHEIESHREEMESEVIPEELRFERMEFDPETDFALEEGDEMTSVAPVALDPDYQYFEINGHLYRTRDKTAGLRKIERRSGRVEYWLGGYALAAVDMYTKQILAIVCFPADEQEYDHYPELMRRVRRALGRYPYAVCADAFSSTEPFFRWNTMRGIASIVPFKAAASRNREDYRTDSYDERGIPRCQHCGGEGDQDSPGYGLYFDASGDARIRFRCKTPQPDEPGCLRNQSIACAENWRLLVPPSRKTELYYALRKRQLFFEGTFRHWRQLYGGQGKEVMSRLARRGVGAQELRAQAALMMQWFRISLRHGWLARPDGALWPTRNENAPIQLSGDRRINGRIIRGVGQRALNRVLSSRRKRGVDVPYGTVAIRKGYARRPAVMVPVAEPPPRPPRGDDGRPPPLLPSL